MDSTFIVGFFGALFAIMNPITNLPIFMSMTEGASIGEQRKIALKTGGYCLALGCFFALLGTQTLNLFGISIDDFRVAGGLVVLAIAFNMLNGEESDSHHGSEEERTDFSETETVSFYPLAFPILVGPGTITTLILFSRQVTDAFSLFVYMAVFLFVLGLLVLTFWNASALARFLSPSARVIMSRFMGMILGAIAISMITDGLKTLMPGLA